MLRRLLNNHQLVFLGPVNVYLAFWTLFPTLYMLILSFTNWKIPYAAKFIGFGNYIEALTSPLFQYSVRVTFAFAVGVSLIELVFGFGIALLLNRQSFLSSMVRGFLIVPMVLTPVVTAMMWRYLYNPSFGPLNYVLSFVGLGPYEWVSASNTVWPSLILIDIWQWTPFPALLILSGLYGLPEDLYEAAEVDGASSVQRFFHLTVPLLRPLLVATFILRFLDSLKLFDSVFVLTRGGPGTATEVLSFHIYHYGIGEFFRIGYGSAMSILVLILSGILSLVFIRFFLQREELSNA
jgi:multiple sugar transport system permease protein